MLTVAVEAATPSRKTEPTPLHPWENRSSYRFGSLKMAAASLPHPEPFRGALTNMWFFSGFLSLLGRLMISAIFLMAAVADLIPQFSDTADHMSELGISAPRLMLVACIAVLVAGSLLVIFGFQTRIGAFLLLIFLAGVSCYYHDFWNQADPVLRRDQLLHFMKNLALAGTMVFLVANGGGAWSLDRRSPTDDSELI